MGFMYDSMFLGRKSSKRDLLYAVVTSTVMDVEERRQLVGDNAVTHNSQGDSNGGIGISNDLMNNSGGNCTDHRTVDVQDNDYTVQRRGTVRCPTCRGVGSVAKEQENELVALIPLKDKRLKPRRTWLYVLGAVAFCIVLAFLLIFFMFPRDVNLSSNMKLLLPSNLTINVTEKYVNFYITDIFNVSNSNYVNIKLTSYSLSVIFDEKVLNTTEENIDMTVSLRDMKSFDGKIGITFDEENGFGAMATVCSEPYSFLHQRYMFFQITVTYSLLGRDEEASFSTTPLVSCGKEDSS